jgi:hypothetical protein
MVRVQGFCVDRWEMSLVDRATREPLSPYYPPQPVALRRIREVWSIERFYFGPPEAREFPLPDLPRVALGAFVPVAVSRAGAVPQGYLTYFTARAACERAGKRLCREDEWLTACRGPKNLRFPYGAHYVPLACNVFRQLHPAAALHGDPSHGHTDPRLNLVDEAVVGPLLRLTGGTPACAVRWEEDAIYDLVGNIDEWIEDPTGVFVGGFYSRGTTEGCDARIASHAAAYFDYSTGARCCKNAQ